MPAESPSRLILICASNEDVIGVESRHGEDTDSRIGQRDCYRCENTRKRKVEGAYYSHCSPSGLRGKIMLIGQTVRLADQRQFVAGPGDRQKLRILRPWR